MKIKQLNLANWQCHEKLTVDFSPGVTTIIGDTDSGKSAVMRAVRWLLLNDFPGESFIKEGAKQTTITCLLRHDRKDWTVGRRRGGGENKYLLEAPSQKTVNFVSFGQGNVPEDLQRLFAVERLNFQNQMDAPFWFALPGGELSRQLNEIVNLDIIDTSLANISRLVYRANERLSVCVARLTDAEQAWEKLAGQAKRVKHWEALQGQRQVIRGIKQRVEPLRVLLERLSELAVDKKQERAKQATSLLWYADQIQKYRSRANQLTTAISAYEQLERLEKDSPPGFAPLAKLFKQWEVSADKTERLNTLISAYAEANTLATTTAEEAATAEKRLHQATKGQRCPLCQQTIKR